MVVFLVVASIAGCFVFLVFVVFVIGMCASIMFLGNFVVAVIYYFIEKI
jgi:hypothetical protein